MEANRDRGHDENAHDNRKLLQEMHQHHRGRGVWKNPVSRKGNDDHDDQ